jgi:hypothetical protein
VGRPRTPDTRLRKPCCSVKPVRHISMFDCFGTLPSLALTSSLLALIFGVLGLLFPSDRLVSSVLFSRGIVHSLQSTFGRFGLLFLFISPVGAVCPHCFGNFPSCTFDRDQKCPTIDVPTANAAIVAAGVGALTLSKIIKPKFMRIFSRVAFDTVLALVKRCEPGTAFEITASTKSTAILTAIENGQVSMEIALFKLCELMEAASDDAERANLKYRLDCLKTASDVRSKLPSASGAFKGLFDSGVLTFMWAKVSEFVMSKGMQVKLHIDAIKGGDVGGTSDLSAKVHRPATMEQFSEMMNLFLLYTHGLAICSAMVLTDFYEHVVYDTIRQRGESWQLAHELMLIMFRRVEDSGGALNLGTVYDEMYLNSVMAEAKSSLQVFFRSPGGNPGIVNEQIKSVKWNKKFNATGRPCRAFNEGTEHTAAMLNKDGSCKFNHVCDKWVSDKGKNGRCLCSAGTPGHSRLTCDNPKRCDECVA